MKDEKTTARQQNREITRRYFLAGAASTVAAFTIVPRSVLGGAGNTPPSERLNIAIIGAGGQGIVNMKRLLPMEETQIVAVCDVNTESDYSAYYFGGTAGREPAKQIAESHYAEQKPSGTYKGCTAYVDFNEMLEKEKGIDAVVVATTDNLHAVAAMAAVKKGKHVYCEKPLTKTVYEARKLTRLAKKAGIATQMGNQGQASEKTRLLCEWVQDGAIGHVREVEVWSDRPYWPQGIRRPKDTPPVPAGLDWDRWLGPAPYRSYHPSYLPFVWRGWMDFGAGALGDMGCHQLDTIFRALKLGPPKSVEASTSLYTYYEKAENKYYNQVKEGTYPRASIVRYEFGARGDMPPVTLTWYDGGLKPARPKELEPERELRNEGELLIGDKGKIMNGRLIPQTAMDAYKRPPKTLPRSIGHHKEWIQACKGGKPAGSNFDFAGPLTEAVLLGNIAIRTGKKLYWDSKKLRITNISQVNQYIHRRYRQGWSL
ncbi:MAG: Gfo/Idh/MocA family protein [Planctomycetota bacterium]|jgi:predicted dehydrogenase